MKQAFFMNNSYYCHSDWGSWRGGAGRNVPSEEQVATHESCQAGKNCKFSFNLIFPPLSAAAAIKGVISWRGRHWNLGKWGCRRWGGGQWWGQIASGWWLMSKVYEVQNWSIFSNVLSFFKSIWREVLFFAKKNYFFFYKKRVGFVQINLQGVVWPVQWHRACCC